jgi:hypothetical protein
MNSITSPPNFMKLYQMVQKTSIDTSYLKPAMPLSHLRPTVNNLFTAVTMAANSKQLGSHGATTLHKLNHNGPSKNHDCGA